MAPSAISGLSRRCLTLLLAILCCVVSLPRARAVITYTMTEESPVGSYIGNVSADSGLQSVLGEGEFANLRFSILSGGSPNSRLFKISATTGVLTAGGRIDREELCPFAASCQVGIEIAAQRQALLRKFDVTVVIADINDNPPTFPKPSVRLELTESTSVDYPVSLDAATDLDGSENFSVRSYSLSPQNVPFRVAHEINAVGASQLSLVVSRPLDREARASYALTVWAYDGGEPRKSGSVSVAVSVQDVNDNAPQFSRDVYAKNISEATPAGSPILTVLATDADEGDNARVVYSVSANQPLSAQRKLVVDPSNGLVSVGAQPLGAGTHRVLVEAQDRGSPPKPPTRAVVAVTVLDTTNSPPTLALDLLSVDDLEPGHVLESAKVSTAVGFLAVSDPDSGFNAMVTCSSYDPRFKLSSLNVNEYKVIISQSLDRENSSRFSVDLVCFDGGSPRLTATATFEVVVVDVNDNPPVFLKSRYSASVAENNGASDGLLQLAATDDDAGNNGNVTYRLVGDAKEWFQIGLLNGMLKARTQFDYEITNRYTFSVLAVDQGQPSLTATATVTINVLDINDEQPRFSYPAYNMSLVEGLEPGEVVGNVTASDLDTGLGGQVDLTLLQTPGLALPFLLTPDGMITCTGRLDREHTAVYAFHVIARDRGMQPLSSSALVTVTVLDVNDNAPTFLFSSYSSSSSPSSSVFNNDNIINNNGSSSSSVVEVIRVPALAERVVAKVHAVDPDAGRNGSVTYAVVGGNASELFRVERATGAVVTLVELDERRLGLYLLVVRASDDGTPRRLHADRNLTLNVVRRRSPDHMVGGGGGSGSGGAGGGGGSDISDSYVVIVVCIVVFTALVSVGVLVTMCVMRKVDKDKRRLKYTAACCPETTTNTSHHPTSGDGGVGGLGVLERDSGGGMCSFDSSSMDYLQQLPSMGGKDRGGHSESGFGSQSLRKGSDSGSLSMAPGFPQQRSSSSNTRTSQLQLPLSHAQHEKKVPLQLDVVRRADDFHSTSSNETTTGDSGHGSDEDIANHSHDMSLRPMSPNYHNLNDTRPLSPSSSAGLSYHQHQPHHNHHHPHHHGPPPPRPLRLGRSAAPSPFVRTGSVSRSGGTGSCLTTPDSTTPSTATSASVPVSAASPNRPIFVHGGQFRGSKTHCNSVRFSDDVRNYEDPLTARSGGGGGGGDGGGVGVGGGRGRYASNDSIRDDDSDLNTTTSGSFSVPPDDLYSDFHSLGYGANKYENNDMLV